MGLSVSKLKCALRCVVGTCIHVRVFHCCVDERAA